jgi:transcriptional regulator with XRE-family HTH domain
MYGLSNKEKLIIILEKVEELDMTSYDIGKKTQLSVSGIDKILNGTSKNPHEKTLNTILEFLESKTLGSELGKLAEPEIAYEKTVFDINKYIKCAEEVNKLTREIGRLQGILTENKIQFKNIFY